MRALLALRVRPTAVVCANDVIAAGAIFECQRQDIDVPGDVSITGFGGLEIGTATAPAITTVHTPVDVMGQRAAHYLLARLNGADSTLQELLATDIIERGSSARHAGIAKARRSSKAI